MDLHQLEPGPLWRFPDFNEPTDPEINAAARPWIEQGEAVNDTYTCSIWIVPAGQEDDFAPAFQQFADGATELGAAEGFILQDMDDPTRFIVVRRWDNPDALTRWQEDSSRRQQAGSALAEITTESADAYVMRKVADLAVK
jgi:heme-degrading monooxygenase HmoA